jgi:hypothetical protein
VLFAVGDGALFLLAVEKDLGEVGFELNVLQLYKAVVVFQGEDVQR